MQMKLATGGHLLGDLIVNFEYGNHYKFTKLTPQE